MFRYQRVDPTPLLSLSLLDSKTEKRKKNEKENWFNHAVKGNFKDIQTYE